MSAMTIKPKIPSLFPKLAPEKPVSMKNKGKEEVMEYEESVEKVKTSVPTSYKSVKSTAGKGLGSATKSPEKPAAAKQSSSKQKRSDPGQNVRDKIKDIEFPLDWMSLDEISVEMSKENMANTFEQLCDLFAYNGFSPEEYHRIMVSLAFAAGIDETIFMEDIAGIVSYGLMRGTTINQRGTQNSVSNDASEKVVLLIDRYGLIDNVDNNKKSRELTSVARTMAAYPEIVANQLQNGVGRVLGEKMIIPLPYMTPSGAAMIPKSKLYDPFFEKYLKWALTFSKIINRKNAAYRTMPEDEALENQRFWSDIARNGSVVPEDRKVSFYKLATTKEVIKSDLKSKVRAEVASNLTPEEEV